MNARRAAGPVAAGTKDIPEGTPMCLSGIKLVFTGELSTINREEATLLAKRLGAFVHLLPSHLACLPRSRHHLLPSCPLSAVTGAPSGVTSFVVVGENAGPSKLDKIAKLKVATLDEDGFFQLIRDRSGKKLDKKAIEVLEKEEKKAMDKVKEMEIEERRVEKERKEIAREREKAGIAPPTT